MTGQASRPGATVSIVMAAFQGEQFVARAVRQLLECTYSDFDVVFVDDGSTDGTSETYLRATAGDSRFHLVTLPQNGGLGAAREVGFRAATGMFVWNVDVDDSWPPEALGDLVAAGHDADVVIAEAWRVDSANRRTLMPAPNGGPWSGREALRFLLAGSTTGHLWNKLIRRSLLHDDVYTAARLHSDQIMLATIFARATTVTVLRQPVYFYEEVEGSNIRSRRPRSDSLAEVDARVREAVLAVDPPLIKSREYRRFIGRSVILSSLRDSVRASYTPDQRATNFAAARSRITLRLCASLVAGNDVKSAALLALAFVSPSAFRWLMSR